MDFRCWTLAALLLASDRGMYAQLTSPYYKVEQQVGLSAPPSSEPANQVQLSYPAGVAIDSNGDLFVADHYALRKIGRDARATTVAATFYFHCFGKVSHLHKYSPIPGGAGGCWARGLGSNGRGEILIAHSGFYQVWLFDGSRRVLAGVNTGQSWGGYSGDGSQATQAYLNSPSGVAADAIGNTYVADSGNHMIRKIAPNGIITRFAGSGAAGNSSSPSGPALSTALNYPMGVATDATGNVYIANTFADTVLRVDTSGRIQRIAGGGTTPANDGDGGPAISAVLRRPASIAVNAAGDIFIAEGNRIRRIRNGIITTFAGSSAAGDSGDGGPATRAFLNYPNAVTVDSAGNIYIADTGNHLVRRVDLAGIITTVAGMRDVPDGKLLRDTLLRDIGGFAVHPDGTLYLCNSASSRIQRVAADGRIYQYAGAGFGYSGDGGPASRARFNGLAGLDFDARGNLYVADSANHRVRRIDTSGTVTTVAGTGEAGFSGDGGSATRAQLNRPQSVAVDKSGAIYIADADNFRIRKVSPNGIITSIAGTGIQGYSGDWGDATSARLWSPAKVVVSESGTVYFSEPDLFRIRKISTDGVISPFAGGGGPRSQDWGAYETIDARAAGLNPLQDMSIDGSGNLFVSAGSLSGAIYTIDPQGQLVDIAGAWRVSTGFLDWDLRSFEDSFTVAREREFPTLSQLALNRTSGAVYALSPVVSRIYLLKPIGPVRFDLLTPREVPCRTGDLVAVKARLSMPDGRPLQFQIIRFTTSDNRTQHPASEVTNREGIAVAQGEAVRCRPAEVYARVLGLPSHTVKLLPSSPSPPPASGATGVRFHESSSRAEATAKSIRYTIASAVPESAVGDGGDARFASLGAPRGVALSPDGELYIADTLHHRIRKVRTDGVIVTVAGTGLPGFSGDGGPAVAAALNTPHSIALDPAGNLFIADRWNYRVRRISPDGIIVTVAGKGEPGEDEDIDRPATDARIGPPFAIAVTADGALYFTSTGLWTGWPQTWTVDAGGFLRLYRRFAGPLIAAGPDNSIYLANISGGLLSGTIQTLTPGNDDIKAQFSPVPPYIRAFAVALNGDVYACEDNRIRLASQGNGARTIAGFAQRPGYSGDGGLAAEALLSAPEGIAIAPDGRIFFSDTGNHRVRVIHPDGHIETVAGGGHDTPGAPFQLLQPSGLALEPSGALWIADRGRSALRRLGSDGAQSTARDPYLASVLGIRTTQNGVLAAAFDRKGVFLFQNDGSSRRLAGEEFPFLFSSTSPRAYNDGSASAVEGGDALRAAYLDPVDVALDGGGSMFVLDSYHRSVRRVSPNGSIFTYTPNLNLINPTSLTIDAKGSVIVADQGGHRVYAIDADGGIRVLLGTGSAGWGVEGRLGWEVETYLPYAVAVDAFGNVYVGGGGLVRKILADGRVFTIAGGGQQLSATDTDGGSALQAALADISAIAVNSDGIVYIAERAANRIRTLTPQPQPAVEP